MLILLSSKSTSKFQNMFENKLCDSGIFFIFLVLFRNLSLCQYYYIRAFDVVLKKILSYNTTLAVYVKEEIAIYINQNKDKTITRYTVN